MTFRLADEALATLRNAQLNEEAERELTMLSAPDEPWVDADPTASPDWEEECARVAAVAERDEYERVLERAPWRDESGLAKLALRQRALRAAQADELRGLVSLWHARLSELPPGVTGHDIELVQRELASELSVVLSVSQRTVVGRLSEAEHIVAHYPLTLAALSSGRIAYSHVREIADAGGVLPAEVRGEFEREVLARAEGLTPRRLRVVARKLATQLGEVSFQERHRAAHAKRAVYVEDLDDGMARLVVEGSAVLIAAVHDRLTRQAKTLTAACEHETRTYDQLRVDLALDLLLTCDPTGDPHAAADSIRAHIALTLPALTLLGQGTEPAMLTSHGPIDLDTATRLAAGATDWVRVLTDPITRTTITADLYRPPKALRALLYARDQRCRFPTCSATPLRGDIDHLHAWADGGTTTPDNLACLCRGHHTLKTIGAWNVTTDQHGTLTWTSTHGITATDTVTHPVRFEAA